MSNKTRGTLCISGLILSAGLSMLFNILAAILCVPLATKLGVEYSSIAIMWTTMSLGATLCLSFLGKLFDKINPKVMYALGAVTHLLGLSSLAFVNSVTAVVVLYFFVGILNVIISSWGLSMLGSKWIGVGRGSIVGLGSAVAAVFSVIFSPIAASCVTTYGFETTAIASGAILFACSLVLALVFICKSPEAYGAEPIDLNFLKKKNEKATETIQYNETKMPLSNIVKLPVLWAVMLIPFLISAVQNGIYSNRAGVFELMGFDLMQIATLSAIWTVANCLFVMLFGFLCDRIGFKKPLIVFAILGIALYFSWPILKSGGYTAGVILCIFANVGQIGNYIGPNVMVPLFGHDKSNTLISWTGFAASIGAMISPIVIALLPSYDTFFIICGVVFVIVLLLSVLGVSKTAVRSIQEQDKKYIEKHGITD